MDENWPLDDKKNLFKRLAKAIIYLDELKKNKGFWFTKYLLHLSFQIFIFVLDEVSFFFSFCLYFSNAYACFCYGPIAIIYFESYLIRWKPKKGKKFPILSLCKLYFRASMVALLTYYRFCIKAVENGEWKKHHCNWEITEWLCCFGYFPHGRCLICC